MTTSPTILTVPIRLILITTAAITAIRHACLALSADLYLPLDHALVVIFNLFLIVVAIWNNRTMLKWSKILTVLSIVISTARFLLYPVVYASLMASRASGASGASEARNTRIFNVEIEIEIESNATSPEQLFVLGMVTGFTLELATGMSVAMDCFDYYMVHRLWRAAKDTEEQEKEPKV